MLLFLARHLHRHHHPQYVERIEGQRRAPLCVEDRRRVQAVTFDPRMFFRDALSPELFVDDIDLSEIEG